MQTSLTCPNFLILFKLLKLSRSLSKSYQYPLVEQKSPVGEILNFTSPDQNAVYSNFCQSRRPYGGQAKLRRYRGHHLGPCAELFFFSLIFQVVHPCIFILFIWQIPLQ